MANEVRGNPNKRPERETFRAAAEVRDSAAAGPDFGTYQKQNKKDDRDGPEGTGEMQKI